MSIKKSISLNDVYFLRLPIMSAYYTRDTQQKNSGDTGMCNTIVNELNYQVEAIDKIHEGRLHDLNADACNYTMDGSFQVIGCLL